jgi:hypothetical protein
MNAATLSGGPVDRSMTWGLRSARLMGWASFGLAVAFFAAPGRIARTFGLEGKENLIRVFGAQEVMAGMGALSTEADAAMWSRSAGDVVHIATVATGLGSEDERQRRNAGWGIAALVGFLAVDTLIAARLSAEKSRARGEIDDYSDRSGFPKATPRADPDEAVVSDAFSSVGNDAQRALEPA